MNCVQCGTPNDASAAFCKECGAPLKTSLCPGCGTEIEAGSAFCIQCGQALIPPVCPSCSQQNNPGSEFCKGCGKPLFSAAVPAGGMPSLPDEPTPAPPPAGPRRRMPGWIWALIGLILLALLAAAYFLLRPGADKATPPGTSRPPTSTTGPGSPFLLFDHFDDPASGWPIMGDRTQGEGDFTGDSGYCFNFYQPGGFHAAWWPERTFTDFTLETEFCTADTIPAIGAGVTLRASEDGWYLFWVYPAESSYIFLKGDDEQVTELIPLTRTDRIETRDWPGQECLHLKVEARADVFEFWVAHPDGEYQFLDTARDSDFASGHLGPSASPPEQPFTPSPIRACFNWISVSP